MGWMPSGELATLDGEDTLVPHLRHILVTVALCHVFGAFAQLDKWLVRTITGEVRLLDVSGPVPAVGPLISGYGQGASEDVNVMTDVSGDPLFYTAAAGDNMVHVRTAALTPMENGDGLLGNESSQASAIVPRPCHPGQYYIVHHDAAAHHHRYSIVDMNQNGGLGAVIEKNLLIEGTLGEGMAVGHQLATGCRWLFTFGIEENAYKLNRSLISALGIGPPETIATVNSPDGPSLASTLKLSPSNDHIALSMPDAVSPSAPDVALWPLNVDSGTVGQVELLPVSDDPVIGLEFSPGGGYLYFAGNSIDPFMDFGRVSVSTYQVDIIDSMIGTSILHMETAGNGRLYVAANSLISSLAEVRYPDAPSVEDVAYDRYAVLIWLDGCMPGLPNSIEGEPPGTTQTPSYIDFDVELLPGCEGHLFSSSACLASTWEWHFGDGTMSLEERPIHHYDVGTFDVTLNIQACGNPLTLTQEDLVTVTGLQPVAVMDHPDTVCQHASVPFTNSSELASNYVWRFGNGASTTSEVPGYAYPYPGEFDVSLVAIEGCITDTTSGRIVVLPAAIASFHTNSDPCDEQTRLVNSSLDGETWYWDFGDGDSTTYRDPVHTYTTMDAFTVTLISDRGTMCADTAQRVLYAGYGIIPVAWFVPNAFTPNGDGTNDELRIKGPEVCASPVMSIFNKWGQPVWEGDSTTGWDGTAGGSPAPEGIYVYLLKGKMSMNHGYVFLLR